MLIIRLVSSVALAMALFLSTADAKPKRPSFGCSMNTIQSAKAAPCIAKAEDDILKDRPYVHVVYCSSTGRLLCCRVDSATQQIIDQSCGILSIRPGGTNKPVATTLQKKQAR